MKINKNLMSRNHTPLRRSKADILYIVIHYVGALGDAYAGTEYYKNNDVGASADFFVGHSGDVWQANDYYNYYSWHCGGGYSGRYFRQCMNINSIGIEMSVRKKSTATMNAEDPDWYFEDATVTAAAELTRHLMQELDIDADHVIRHYDVNQKWCPAPYCRNNTRHTWEEFKRLISAEPAGLDCSTAAGAAGLVHATQLNGMTEAEKIAAMAPLYQAEQRRTGMLASVGLAQFCLESGYGTTDLAQKADNLHGMKCGLSGNTWAGSTWDGGSKYTKQTAEQDANGNVYYVTADFRKYASMADSIADRSAYFIGARNGDALRYPGINTITDVAEQCRAIKAGDYATDISYVDKLLSLISRYDLTQYDDVEDGSVKTIVKAAEAIDAAVRTDIKAGFVWTYTNRLAMAETFAGACEAGNRKVNCARGVNWVLTEAGIFDAYPGRFYGKKGGTVIYASQKVKAAILAKYDVLEVKNKTVSQCLEDGTILAGDIVTYMDMSHTNLYLGGGRWFDTGHAYCDGPGEGAAFTGFIGGTVHGAQFVGCILRLKAAALEPSKPAVINNDGTTWYRVQVGSYSVKANADARMAAVRDASGYGCFIEERDGQYKVICGSFASKENARERADELKRRGIDAIIKEVV